MSRKILRFYLKDTNMSTPNRGGMKSVIEQILTGKRDIENIKDTTAIKKILGKVAKADEEFREKLSEELLESYEKLNDLVEDMGLENEKLFYIEGFKFGLLIGVEAAGE